MQIKEKRLRTVFSSNGGQITDVQLKYSKDGVFRQFAFIGFKDEKDASKAAEYFNDTFLDTSRIKVELSVELCDTDKKPRSWSKYSKDSSEYMKKNETKTEVAKKDEKKVKKKSDDILENLKNDLDFKEFVEVHRKVNDQQIWNNNEACLDKDEEEREEESGGDDEDGNEGSEDEDEEEENNVNIDKKISDLEVCLG